MGIVGRQYLREHTALASQQFEYIAAQELLTTSRAKFVPDNSLGLSIGNSFIKIEPVNLI